MSNSPRVGVRHCGGYAAVAKQMGLTRQAVWRWFNTPGGKVPAERVLEFERVTGVSRHDIRPDVYPIEKHVPQAAE